MVQITESKFLTTCAWSDVPHLDAKTQRELLASTPPYLRDARSKGLPSLGSGAIYPVSEDEILVDNFEIPDHYLRAFALDVGWNRTACIWGAKDPNTDIIYLYSEYYRSQAEPVVHAEAIKSRGEWIRGCIDPAARGRGQKDGTTLFDMYTGYDLSLVPANNSVVTGIDTVWQRLSGGGLKVFRSGMGNTLAEYRIYRRDAKGNIVKQFDHLMDCMRYLVMTFDVIAQAEPYDADFYSETSDNTRDRLTGY